MNSRKVLSLDAARAALSLRQRLGKQPWQALDAIDLAEATGVEVRFLQLGSMEGMYYQGESPLILLPSERPCGRRAFSCAHELGHHAFNHGSRLDALGSRRRNEIQAEEWIADMFAAFLLMPPAAVRRGFTSRGLDPRSASPFEVLCVAQWLGVGYETLVTQAASTLNLVDQPRAVALKRVSPIELCRKALDVQVTSMATFADTCWTDRAIDIETGSQLIVPEGTQIEERVLAPGTPAREYQAHEAVSPGSERVVFPGGTAAFVRVSRCGYVGRAKFRFLPDPDFLEGGGHGH